MSNNTVLSQHIDEDVYLRDDKVYAARVSNGRRPQQQERYQSASHYSYIAEDPTPHCGYQIPDKGPGHSVYNPILPEIE